ncbi:MAG: NB-ARC domain-containing protein [Thermomicrobiales bacterium]
MEQAQTDITSALPRVPHRLIGRERERAAARDALLERAAPLLTLTGPGGVGKTRLALAIGSEVGDRFRDGVVWVDLAAISDPTHVPANLAEALRLTLPAVGEIEDYLARLLRPRQLLLLLDNCEHLLATVAPLVSALLTRCPALQVLATSRAPLRLRWEQILPVPPLPTPVADETLETIAGNEAIRLFVERARAVQPDFTLTATNKEAVARLCQQLDGLPLAIELAAARSAVLSPEAMVAQMRDRLRLLASGPRDVPPRHETIAATIAWSYDLLDAESQWLFRRLAVFLGGFTLEAVAEVAGKGGE